ncbi:MAG: DUF3239 domain-containing protein [Planctomycetota bacterium]
MVDPQAGDTIRVACPHCGATAKAPRAYLGRKVRCRSAECAAAFVLVAPEAERAAREPAAAIDLEDEWDPPAEPAFQPPRKPTGAKGTFASNPAEIRLNFLRWVRHKPLIPAIGVVSCLFIVGLWAVLTAAGMKASIPTKDGGETPIWLFGPACLAGAAVLMRFGMPNFGSGDANPGVVVSVQPTLLAVPTDLTQGVGEFPAVKIVRINLVESGGAPIELGSRVPTVAHYADAHSKHANHWSDFYPVPVEYATGDPSAVDRLLRSFPNDQYELLDHALACIEQPYQAGLYALWPAPGKKPGRRIKGKADF